MRKHKNDFFNFLILFQFVMYILYFVAATVQVLQRRTAPNLNTPSAVNCLILEQPWTGSGQCVPICGGMALKDRAIGTMVLVEENRGREVCRQADALPLLDKVLGRRVVGLLRACRHEQ